MKETVPVSVIIPNYNKSEYLEECISSIMGQTVSPAEIIVVDDASSDGSVDLLERLKANIAILKVVGLTENRGVSHARNRGVQEATSRYITFLDSDDFYLGNDKLKNEYELLKKHPDVIAYSPIVVVDVAGKRLWGQLDQGKKMFQQGRIGLSLIAGFKSRRPPRDYIVSKEAFLDCGSFDEALSLYEDYDLLIRLGLNHDFICTFREGTAYRQISGGLSDRSYDDLALAKRSVCEKYRRELSSAPLLKVKVMSFLQNGYECLRGFAKRLIS